MNLTRINGGGCEIILLAIFVASTFVGYVLIKNVPNLFPYHLMSGMNALSGITV